MDDETTPTPIRNRPPNAGKGRVKGVPNRSTRAAKECIELAAEGLGGVTRLIEWAKEDPLNERVFWGSIYPKLLPLTAHIRGSVEVAWPLSRSKLEP